MAFTSKIAWTDATFNYWVGCTKVSPACKFCYAEELMDTRYGFVQWGKDQPRRLTNETNRKKPLEWHKQCLAKKERMRVFAFSLGDVFDEEVADEWRKDFWTLVEKCWMLDWMVLTKRPENFSKFLPWNKDYSCWTHVQLGVSAENQEWLEKRINYLIETPCATRFISAEPLLGDLQFKSEWLAKLHQVIVGGESHKSEARRTDPEWFRSVRDQCKKHKVPFFFKQGGTVLAKEWGCKNSKAEDISEVPEEFRVQERAHE